MSYRHARDTFIHFLVHTGVKFPELEPSFDILTDLIDIHGPKSENSNIKIAETDSKAFYGSILKDALKECDYKERRKSVKHLAWYHYTRALAGGKCTDERFEALYEKVERIHRQIMKKFGKGLSRKLVDAMGQALHLEE